MASHSPSPTNGLVSVKLVFAVLTVAAVVFTGAITISVTVTETQAGLRRFGELQAKALTDVTLIRFAQYWERPAVADDTMRNTSKLRPFLPLSNNTMEVVRWLDVTTFFYFALPFAAGVSVMSVDGAHVHTMFRRDVGVTFMRRYETQIVPYKFAIPENDHRQLYTNRDLKLAPPSSELYNTTTWFVWNPTLLLSLANSMTLGGRYGVWSGDPIFVELDDENGYLEHTIVGTPLRFRGDVLGAYGGVYTFVSNVTDYLNLIRVTPNSYGFVIDNKGFLLGSSYPVPYQNMTRVDASFVAPLGCTSGLAAFADATKPPSPTKLMACRAHMQHYPYPPLQAVSPDAVLSSTTEPAVRYITVGSGEEYLVTTAAVPMRYPNMATFLVLTIPVTEALGDIVTPRNTAIGMSVCVAVFGAALAVAVIVAATRPLQAVARALEATDLGMDEDEGRASDTVEELAARGASSDPLWVCAEARELELAHRAMARELKRIRGFIPAAAFASDSTVAHLERYVVSRPSSPHGADAGEALPPASPTLDLQQSPTTGRLVTGSGNDESSFPSVSPARQSDSPEDSAATRRVDRATNDAMSSASRRSARTVRFLDDGDENAPSSKPLLRKPLAMGQMLVRHVAVLVANTHGALSSVADGSVRSDSAAPSTVTVRRAMHLLVAQARAAVRAHGGAIERFHGDDVMASFNAAKSCTDAGLRAVRAGLELTAPAGAGAHDESSVRWRVAVASGRCIVGHAGTAGMTGFNIIGAAVTHAVALERIAKLYRRGGAVMIAGRMFAELEPFKEQVSVRALGLERLPGMQRRCAVGETRRRATGVGCHDLAANVGSCVSTPGRASGALVAASVVQSTVRRLLHAEVLFMGDGREEAARTVRSKLLEVADVNTIKRIEIAMELGGTDVPALRELYESGRWTQLAPEECAVLVRQCVARSTV